MLIFRCFSFFPPKKTPEICILCLTELRNLSAQMYEQSSTAEQMEANPVATVC